MKQRAKLNTLTSGLFLAAILQLAGIYLFYNQAVGVDSNEYLALSHSMYSSGEYSIPPGLNGFSASEGESPTRMRQPIYPLLLIPIYWMTGGSILVLLLIQVLFSCISLYFIYKLFAMFLEGRKSHPFALLLPPLYFPWLLLSSKVLSESLFTLLIWAALYFIALERREKRRKHLITAGILLGLGILTKSIGLVIAIFTIFIFMQNCKVLDGFKKWLLVISFAAVVVLPWGVRNWISLGTPTFLPSNSGYNLWVASRAIGNPCWSDSEEFSQATKNQHLYYIEQRADENFREQAIDNFTKDSPLVIVGRGFYRVITAWTRFPGSGDWSGFNAKYILFSTVQTSMLLLAAFALFRLRSSSVFLFLFLPFLALSCALPISKGLTRYLLPALPAVVLLAGYGFLEAISLMRNWSSRDKDFPEMDEKRKL